MTQLSLKLGVPNEIKRGIIYQHFLESFSQEDKLSWEALLFSLSLSSYLGHGCDSQSFSSHSVFMRNPGNGCSKKTDGIFVLGFCGTARSDLDPRLLDFLYVKE